MSIYYTVYKVTNTINNYIYIGQHTTTNLNDRYLGSGLKLKNAIKKHGREAFIKEILFVFETFEEMDQKEAELVNEDFIKNNNTYNIVTGGSSGIGQNNKGRPAWNKGLIGAQKHTAETRLKMSDAQKGVAKTSAHKKNISKGRIGKFDLSGEKNPFYGKQHSEEARQKMSAAKKGKIPKSKGKKIGG